MGSLYDRKTDPSAGERAAGHRRTQVPDARAGEPAPGRSGPSDIPVDGPADTGGDDRYRPVLSVLPAAMYTCDADGVITYFNEQATLLWGRSPALGETDQRFCGSFRLYNLDGSLLPHERTPMALALQDGQSYRAEEVVIERPGGTRVIVSVNIDPIYDAVGHCVGAINVFTDISDRKRAEDSLRESRRQLALVLDIAPIFVAHCDRDGRFRLVNRAYAERFGLSPEDLVGRHIADVLGDVAYATVRPWIDAVLSGKTVEFETEVTLPSTGPRIMHARYAPESDGAEVFGFVAVVTDVTERAELERQRAALLESERAARAVSESLSRAKDEFLSLISHELRSPLATVLGWAQMLRTGKLSPEDTEFAVDAVLRGSAHLKQLIDDLLDVSRFQSGKLKLELTRVDLVALAREALVDLRPAALEKRVLLEDAIAVEAAHVHGDPARLRQVFTNLLSNAVKFTPAEGRVRLRILPDVTRVVLSIEDTGIGIAPASLDGLFERFRQADGSITRKYQGLGLGLALVKQITELHGGSVHAESEGEGKGATFVVELPRSADAPGAAAEDSWIADLRGVRVLVVDDDPAALALTSRLLEEAGAAVARCASAAQAVEAIGGREFDVLISDISMPEMDGYELLEIIRGLPDGRRASIPAIAVTAFGREEDERRSLEAGYHAHHTKPVDPTELTTLIRDVCLCP